jgi:hypothetical protein
MPVLKGKEFNSECRDGFPPMSVVFMSEFGWINEAIFLK